MLALASALFGISPFLYLRVRSELGSAQVSLSELSTTSENASERLLVRRHRTTIGIDPIPGGLKSDAHTNLRRLEASLTNIDMLSAANGWQLGGMPSEDEEFLVNLNAIEDKRQHLAASQLSSAYNSDVSTMSQHDVLHWLSDSEDAWAALFARFESLRTPPDCVALQATYSRTLRETGAAVARELRVMHGLSCESSQASWSGSDYAVRIPVTPAEAAKRELAELCSRYGAKRPFTFATVVGSFK
jgi:hypothetical protein